MADYRTLPNGFVLRTADGVSIPSDPHNRDYAAYLAWASNNSTDPVLTVMAASDVDTYRDRRLASGYVDSVTGHTYQCDPESRGFWTALAASAGLGFGPPSYPIITADNTVVVMAAADVFSLINNRIMPWVSATVLYARSVKSGIVEGNPPADLTVGWP